MAGCIFKTKFVSSKNKAFRQYIDYIDRDEAVRKHKDCDYNLFNDYMGNPEKSTGLFTVNDDNLNSEQKKELKDVFERAEKKGSLMYQSIFSFEKDWLIVQNLIDDSGNINEKSFKNHTRSAMAALFKAENMEGFVWSAAIHYNTDHYHIHIAYVDPDPSWEEGKGRCRRNSQGELYQRGKFEQKSIDKTKSAFINEAIGARKANEYINNILRAKILVGRKNIRLEKDKTLRTEFKGLVQQLSTDIPDMRKWNYGMNAMIPYRDRIDKLTDMFIEIYFKEDFEEYKKAVNELSLKYKEAYGGTKEAEYFAKTKMYDLYYRLGNSILSECRNYMKEQDHMKEQAQRISNTSIYNSNSSLKKSSQKNILALRQIFQKDLKNLKNQIAYEKFRKQQEWEQQQ